MGDTPAVVEKPAVKPSEPLQERETEPRGREAVEAKTFRHVTGDGTISSSAHFAAILQKASPTSQVHLMRQFQRRYGNACTQGIVSQIQTREQETQSRDGSSTELREPKLLRTSAPPPPPPAGNGKPIPSAHRVPFEDAFNQSLGHVRIHTGSAVDHAAREIQAQAFTVGSDIYVPSTEPEPGSAAGDRLLAHELTHVVQHDQGRIAHGSSRGTTVSSPTDPLELEAYAQERPIADAVAAHLLAINDSPSIAQPHSTPASASSTLPPHFTDDGKRTRGEHVSNQALSRQGDQPVIYRSVWDDLGAVYDQGTGIVTDAAGNVLEMGSDLFWKVIREVAPGIVPYIQEISSKGIIGYLREKASAAFKGIFGGLRNSGGAIAGLIETFSKLGAAGVEILTALSKGDCQPLFNAVGRLGDTLMEMAGDAWDAIKDFLAPVGDFFGALWDKFGAPAVDFLTEYASDTWENIKALGALIWDLTEPVRDALKAAWDWIKEQLGIGEGPDSKDGLLQWVQKNLAEAWKEITELLQPVIAPMKAFVAKIKAILPLDAILNLRETIHGWLKQAGDMVGAMSQPQGVTENQEALRDQILPAVKGSIVRLGITISSAGSWIAVQIGGIAETVTGFFTSLQSNTLVSAAAGAIQWVQDKVTALSEWVQSGVIGLFDTIGSGIAKLSEFVEPVLNVLKKVVSVIGDVVSELPGLVLGPLWKAIPACIREPIKKFIIEHILSAIPIISTFVKVPEIWTKIQKLVMDFLSMVFVKGDLGGAAMMVIRFVLEAVGVDVDQFFRILGKAASSIDEIIMHPVEFMTNLFGAIKNGLGRFLSNIGRHLINGLLGWLLGPLQDLGITPPKELTLSAILDLALQVIGISKDKILAKVEKAVPGAKRVIDEAWRWISALIQGGLGGLWEEIKSRLSDLWETVIGGLTQWITVELVEAGIAKLTLMSNPAGAIIEAIRTIYTTLTFFVEKINQIMALVESVLNSLGKIVKGDIASAAAWIEDAMARTVPTVIAFFADWLGFDDPAPHIRKIVLKIQAKVDTALDWLVGKAVGIGKKILGVFGGGEDKKDSKDDKKDGKSTKDPGEVGKTLTFSAAGKGHRLWINVQGTSVTVMLASIPDKAEAILRVLEEQIRSLPQGKRAEGEQLLASARQNLVNTQKEAQQAAQKKEQMKQMSADPTAQAEFAMEDKETEAGEETLANTLKQLYEIVKGTGQHAANWEAVQAVIGQPMGIPLPSGYSYRTQDGRQFPQRTQADDSLYEQLGLDKDNKIKLGSSEEMDKHPSKFVSPVKEGGNWVLLPDYRGKHMIRTRFYRSGDGYAPEAVKRRDEIITANTDPQNPNNWVHVIFTLGKSVSKQDYTVEHSMPVSVHWNSQGNADVQSNRVSWFSFAGRSNEVEVLSREANSKKGSGGVDFVYVVKLTFRGPGD